ncbi:Uma2 family endonuclease [Limnoglobus roseus]|uniref:Uma2 family endonuclease n=1 Tax=Limnoglobus roseus TaxID=2598579 RepID=A0A5C1A876_9BACT|nr:Uma2 family endonuclease [Limnoglobus roseus]QEL15529.1 Uma2 family endonuclease [Limnoglobus roseus]
MSATAAKLITAEEFSKMPDLVDGSKQELVRGVIVTMPPTKGRHGFVQANIAILLGGFVKTNRLGWVVTESGTVLERDPDTVRGPDVSFYSITRHPDLPDEWFEIPPDLAVEVLSPSDRRGRVREKVREYLANGVRIVWLVDPDPQTVTVYAGTLRGVEFDSTDTLDAADVLPGFTCQIADFFA